MELQTDVCTVQGTCQSRDWPYYINIALYSSQFGKQDDLSVIPQG